MNPSRFCIPQQVSPDRIRARAATIAYESAKYKWVHDTVEEGPNYRRLPPRVDGMPEGEDFSPPLKVQLGLSKLRMKANAKIGALRAASAPVGARRYQVLYPTMDGPDEVMRRWMEDAEFARQRLTGVNPMRIRAVRELAPGNLRDAVADTLSRLGLLVDIDDRIKTGRLFEVSYPELASPLVQRHVRKGSLLAAPRAIFYVDAHRTLMPLAIQLSMVPGPGHDVVRTPNSSRWNWMYARTLVQCADAHLHEGYHHLLETHLLNELFHVALCRTVHPEHPIRQLLDPHHTYTIAINHTARGHLLAPGGPIDLTMGGTVAGVLDATRVAYSSWHFDQRSLFADLAERGVADPELLPRYYYRDDAQEMRFLLMMFVYAMVGLWYHEEEEVATDGEIQAFARELADSKLAGLPGFNGKILTRTDLAELAVEIMFRGGPQHAAVNNGQYDAYGFVPNVPGTVLGQLRDSGELTEEEYWACLPATPQALQQLGMAWVLSEPTQRTILQIGESPAFHPSLSPQAEEILAAARRALQTLSVKIEARNREAAVPYIYLDPHNVSRSTDI